MSCEEKTYYYKVHRNILSFGIQPEDWGKALPA